MNYFEANDVPESLREAAVECANIREVYDKRVPFEWGDLPAWNTFSSFNPPPMAEGQVAVFHRFNEISGQVIGTSRARAIWMFGILVWRFDPEIPAEGVGTFVCD